MPEIAPATPSATSGPSSRSSPISAAGPSRARKARAAAGSPKLSLDRAHALGVCAVQPRDGAWARRDARDPGDVVEHDPEPFRQAREQCRVPVVHGDVVGAGVVEL